MSSSYVTIKEGADKHIATHTFIENGIEKHVERMALSTGVLELPSTPQISDSTTGIFPVDEAIDISGKGVVVIKSLFSDARQSCTVKIIFYDSNNKIIGVTSEQTIYDTGLEEDTKYVGQLIIIENKIGASKLKINIMATPTSGNISFYVAGV